MFDRLKNWLKWRYVALVQDAAIKRRERKYPGYRRLTAEELAEMVKPLPDESDELPDDDHLCCDCGKPLDNVREDMCDGCWEAHLKDVNRRTAQECWMRECPERGVPDDLPGTAGGPGAG